MDRSLAASRVIITDSHFTRNELLEHCPHVEPERVVVTHLGVDLCHFSNPSHAARIDEVRARLRLPRQFVLYLGTLEPRKNLQGLVKGYCRLPAELQCEYPLVLAGMCGWNQSFFRRDLDELRRRGVVHEVGYVHHADVPVLMRAASVFCFPSLYEGFGLPPLEAAACGTPVLSSRAASLPEVLGEAAYYVDPSSPDEIGAGLQRLLEDRQLSGQLAAAGPVRAARFPWEQCARQTLAAYRAAA
jgi:alpha-1,3-rhamnosyl/mannosyltransferase